MHAGKNGRRTRQETMLTRFSVTFLEWIRKVFPSLNQRNLVCSNQIILIDNRSTAYPNLPKLDIFSAEAPFSLKRSSFGRSG